MRLLYQGLLRSPASWARVGRGYLEAFVKLGLPAEAVSPRGFLYDKSFPLPDGVVEVPIDQARSGPPPDVGLGFLHPPRIDRLLGRLRVNLFVWESDVLPAGWAEQLDRGADLVVAPGEFTRAALRSAGLPAGKVALAPYGFDERLASVAPPPAGRVRERPFSFLAVMAPHWRKGVSELLAAYRSAFKARDEVLLRIKTTYDPGAARSARPFEIPSWAEVITRAGLSAPDAPRFELDLRVVPDGEVAVLHSSADVVIAPTWGESFGLSILEGLAAARPVIATAWGGHMDFLPGGPDAIPFRLVEAGDRLYELAPGARAAVPDVPALSQRMRWHFDHAEESRDLGLRSRDHVAGLTWLAAARRLLDVLREAGGDPVRSAGDRRA